MTEFKEDPATKGPTEDPITGKSKEDPITGKPKEDPTTEKSKRTTSLRTLRGFRTLNDFYAAKNFFWLFGDGI